MNSNSKPYHSMYIANYIISYCSDHELEINNLRLQKIMYFLQARFLVEKNVPLFNENLQKWKYGPVVPSVYHEYKSSGASQITKNDISQIFRVPDVGEEPNFLNEYIIENFSLDMVSDRDDQLLINDTIKNLSKYEPFKLVEITHSHSIWNEDEEQILFGASNIEYDNDKIKLYFTRNPEAIIWKN